MLEYQTLGGCGQCKSCGEIVNNVSYHEAWECSERTINLLVTDAQPPKPHQIVPTEAERNTIRRLLEYIEECCVRKGIRMVLEQGAQDELELFIANGTRYQKQTAEQHYNANVALHQRVKAAEERARAAEETLRTVNIQVDALGGLVKTLNESAEQMVAQYSMLMALYARGVKAGSSIKIVGRTPGGQADVVYLADGHKITVGRDSFTSGPAWLRIDPPDITSQSPFPSP